MFVCFIYTYIYIYIEREREICSVVSLHLGMFEASLINGYVLYLYVDIYLLRPLHGACYDILQHMHMCVYIYIYIIYIYIYMYIYTHYILI